jgi:hypothetical protein
MLINIFSFCYHVDVSQNTQSTPYYLGLYLVHKRLKIRKLGTKRAIFSAFQTTILRTFFELAKFF